MACQRKLSGKVAIITGSSSGFGAAIAVEFCREGASVTLTGRNKDRLKEIAQKCEEAGGKGQKTLIVIGDICNEDVRKELIDMTMLHYGKIDILVNNAGSLTYIPFEMQSLKNLDEHLDIHLRVPYHLTQLALKHLKESKGVVINMSSVAGIKPCFTTSMDYHIAKAALNQFTRYLAYDLGNAGIRVNSLNPGFIPTEIHKRFLNYDQEAIKMMEDATVKWPALNRAGSPTDVALAAVFLASGDSAFMTGVNLPVDGGFLAKPPITVD